METTTITAPETGQLAAQGADLVAQARALAVDSPESYAVAGVAVVEVKGVRKRIAALFKDAVGKAFQAHRAMCSLRDQVDRAPKDAEAILKKKLGDYDREEERKRREEEDRLRELARVQAEDRQLADAVAAEAAGDAEEAEEIIAEPIAAPVVVLGSTVPKVPGVSGRVYWKFRIVDEALIPRDHMMPNDKTIGAYARSMKGKASMPGVEFYPDHDISVRSN